MNPAEVNKIRTPCCQIPMKQCDSVKWCKQYDCPMTKQRQPTEEYRERNLDS